jgi:hypothetical protein
MTLDMKKIRARKNALESRGNGGSNFWRPQDGESVIRIVSPPDGDPFKDYWFHYNLGNNAGFLSPKKNFGEDCPLDDFVRNLFNEGTTDSIKMAKNLMARQRFFSPVLVRGEEDKGIRVWGYGKMVYEQLLNLVLNPEYGDITDPDAGTDLVINYGKPAGAQFPQTKITPRRRPSELCQEGSERCAEMLETIPEMDSLFEKKSHADVQKMLDGFLLGAEENSSETSKYADSGASDTSSVEKAFDELLGS